MQLVEISNGGYKRQFLALYDEAFPREEKKSVDFMEELVRRGAMEMMAIINGEQFVGLAAALLSEKIVILDYFAVSSSVRSRGYGGKALELLKKRYGGRKLILEIEVEDPDAENALYRMKRKAFYIRNGMKETGVYAHVYNTDFELLSVDGKLSYEEYVQALECSMGAQYTAKLRPKQIFKGLPKNKMGSVNRDDSAV